MLLCSEKGFRKIRFAGTATILQRSFVFIFKRNMYESRIINFRICKFTKGIGVKNELSISSLEILPKAQSIASYDDFANLWFCLRRWHQVRLQSLKQLGPACALLLHNLFQQSGTTTRTLFMYPHRMPMFLCIPIAHVRHWTQTTLFPRPCAVMRSHPLNKFIVPAHPWLRVGSSVRDACGAQKKQQQFVVHFFK